jgi:WD40 repeat protein
MTSDSVIVEDGIDGETRGDTRSSWILVAAAFILGLALGTLASAAPAVEDEAGPAEIGDPETLEAPFEPAPDESDSGISDLVPEFPDALVAVSAGIGSGHDYLLWPPRGPVVGRSLTGGANVMLDATGQFVALSHQVPDLEGSVLSFGRFNGIRAVSSGVTSYEWHDSKSGFLAFTTTVEGEWELHRVSGSFEPSTVATGPGDGQKVAAWGEWGFALQSGEGGVTLLNAAGQQKSTVPGEVLTSHDSGWLLVEEQGGLKLVSAGGGVRRLDLGEIADPVFAAEFSPDGGLVAVAGRFGIEVYDLTSETEVASLSAYPGGWLAWSSDSRFVVAPARSGIVIHDLETGDTLRALMGHNVVVGQVLPLSSS